MKKLTQRQEEILGFLTSFQKKMGRTPTGPEIARHFGFSDHSTAYQHLKQLEQKGYLELIQLGRRQPLGIRLSDRALHLHTPTWTVLGSIPAGPLTDVLTDVTRQIEGVQDLVPGIRPGDYFLVVDGDSMIDAGLQPGQYVIIRPEAEPKQGDICAVWIDGEGGTLKRVYAEGEMVRLVPANPKYKEQTHPVDRVRIQGVLVAALAIQSFKR